MKIKKTINSFHETLLVTSQNQENLRQCKLIKINWNFNTFWRKSLTESALLGSAALVLTCFLAKLAVIQSNWSSYKTTGCHTKKLAAILIKRIPPHFLLFFC